MDKILAIIQDDLGGRGIRHLIDRSRDILALTSAASKLLSLPKKSHVAILTGFPCVQNSTPPTETDGIAGSFAIAYALQVFGYHVHIFTDQANESVLAACIDEWQNLSQQPRIDLHSFSPQLDSSEQENLDTLFSMIACWIAIERPGAASDGKYYTMSARDISASVAPLDECFVYANLRGVLTIAIGDGGNELGLGSVADLTKKYIPHGETIAASTPCQHLILASVSDWGGYALTAALQFLQPELSCMTHPSMIAKLTRRMVESGACDGILGVNDAFIDGYPLVVSLNRLHALMHVNEPRYFRLLTQYGDTEWPRVGTYDASAYESVYKPFFQCVSIRDSSSAKSLRWSATVLTSIDELLVCESTTILLPAKVAFNEYSVLQSWKQSTKGRLLGVKDASLDDLQHLMNKGAHVNILQVEFHPSILGKLVQFCQQHAIAVWIAMSSVTLNAYGRSFAQWLLQQQYVDSLICDLPMLQFVHELIENHS